MSISPSPTCQLQKACDTFFDQLFSANRKVGELETKLMQLEFPKTDTNG